MGWNWNKTNISLHYTADNLRMLLDQVCRKENPFSHYELSKWCDNFAMTFEDDRYEEWNDELSLAVPVARDIECQWDLYLITTYSPNDLASKDLSLVELPFEWFDEWRIELKQKQDG